MIECFALKGELKRAYKLKTHNTRGWWPTWPANKKDITGERNPLTLLIGWLWY